MIETAGAEQRIINEGTTVRFHDLAAVDVADRGGTAAGQRVPRPAAAAPAHRHRDGAASARLAGVHPAGHAPFLIVVAPAGPPPRAADLRAFVSDGRQGVNYAKGVWHHPVIAWQRPTDFLVVDRGGPGDNLVEIRITGERPQLVEASA